MRRRSRRRRCRQRDRESSARAPSSRASIRSVTGRAIRSNQTSRSSQPAAIASQPAWLARLNAWASTAGEKLDADRARRWAGEQLDIGRRDGSYALFALAAALATAPYDDRILRRTVRRIGLLDRTDTFDRDAELHERIETIFAGLSPRSSGPPREELLAHAAAS